MSFTPAELRFLGWLVGVAQQAVPANHPAAEHIPTMLTLIDLTSSCSSARTGQHDISDSAEQFKGQGITTREAAHLLGVTQRAVQKRIQRGHLKADRVGKTWLIDRRNFE